MDGVVFALGGDVLAIGVLAYGIYFRRFYRRDLMLAYVALNVGIFSVTALLTGSKAGLGLGLGLFGILSIIRLRSDSITQEEVAYYFISLAIGLVGGLHPGAAWVAPVFSAGLVLVMFVVDHPRLTATAMRQTITLDKAYPDHTRLRTALEQLLGAQVMYVVVTELDMVRDTTVADVRFKVTPRHRALRPSMRSLGFDHGITLSQPVAENR